MAVFRSGAARLSSIEAVLRPVLVRLPPRLAVGLYSTGRRRFLGAFVHGRPRRPVEVPPALGRRLWGLDFRSPIGNAAGMFKSGAGYAAVAAQGAGSYLAGTTTATPRTGNRRKGIAGPFAPYPRSGAASNWLGLPNPGHAEIAARLAEVERVPGCPMGASLSADPAPEIPTERKIADLVAGLEAYEKAGIDFLEINESCPNTEAAGSEDGEAQFEAMADRLWQVAEYFLSGRQRRLPVIVKLSTDTALGQVPRLLDLLLELGFDGVNFGNTSVAYGELRKSIAPAERRLYDYFVDTFGGGVSGRPLRALSLALVESAAEHLAKVSGQAPGQTEGGERELHIVRTGGVESAADVAESLSAGASLVQWYSGCFEAFARDGQDVYRCLYSRLEETELEQAEPEPGEEADGSP